MNSDDVQRAAREASASRRPFGVQLAAAHRDVRPPAAEGGPCAPTTTAAAPTTARRRRRVRPRRAPPSWVCIAPAAQGTEGPSGESPARLDDRSPPTTDEPGGSTRSLCSEAEGGLADEPAKDTAPAEAAAAAAAEEAAAKPAPPSPCAHPARRRVAPRARPTPRSTSRTSPLAPLAAVCRRSRRLPPRGDRAMRQSCRAAGAPDRHEAVLLREASPHSGGEGESVTEVLELGSGAGVPARAVRVPSRRVRGVREEGAKRPTVVAPDEVVADARRKRRRQKSGREERENRHRAHLENRRRVDAREGVPRRRRGRVCARRRGITPRKAPTGKRSASGGRSRNRARGAPARFLPPRNTPTTTKHPPDAGPPIVCARNRPRAPFPPRRAAPSFTAPASLPRRRHAVARVRRPPRRGDSPRRRRGVVRDGATASR